MENELLGNSGHSDTLKLPYETRPGILVVGRGAQSLEICDRRPGRERRHWFVGINSLTGTEIIELCSCK